MEFYKWDDRLSVNHAKIDLDHKTIIEKARELSESMMKGKGKENIIKTVDFLNNYVKTHFEEEEKIQQKTNYPKYLDHKKNHEYFIDQLQKLTVKIKENPTASINAIELNKLISGWFINHIKKMDVEVASHINKHTT